MPKFLLKKLFQFILIIIIFNIIEYKGKNYVTSFFIKNQVFFKKYVYQVEGD